MPSRRTWAALLLAVLALLPLGAPAQELYVVTEDYPPYNYLQDGEVVGFSTEILRAVLKRADIGYQLDMLPKARAYRIAENAKDVLIYSMPRVPEREELFHWVGPIAPRSVYFFRLSRRGDLAPAGDAELTQYTMGVLRDGAAELLARRLGFVPDKNLVLAQDLGQLLRLLDAGRIDLFAANPCMVRHEIGKYDRKFSDYVSCYTKDCEQGFYFGISRGSNSRTVERVQRAFAVLSKDGTMEKIRSRHNGSIFK